MSDLPSYEATWGIAAVADPPEPPRAPGHPIDHLAGDDWRWYETQLTHECDEHRVVGYLRVLAQSEGRAKVGARVTQLYLLRIYGIDPDLCEYDGHLGPTEPPQATPLRRLPRPDADPPLEGLPGWN